MNSQDAMVGIVTSGFAIIVGGLLVIFAPAFVRLQIRMLEWQIKWMKQSWALVPLRFFGAVFVTLGVLGLVQIF